MIKIYEPYKISDSLPNFTSILENEEITYIGSRHGLVNKRLDNLLGSRSILLANGTCATHMLSDLIATFRPSIKNLIVPNNVYVAAWNSFLFGKNKFDLIPVDASLDTWNYDLNKLESLLKISDPYTTAVLIVHNLGNIINVPRLKRLFPDFIFVEDNCEGFTGKYEGSYSGTKSLASSVSFYANKIITSGEGGALIVNEESLLEYATSLHSQGQSEERYLHNILAYNYRMTNLQAALLDSQIDKLEEILNIKNYIWSFYDSHLDKSKIIRPSVETGCNPSMWMYAIRIKEFDYHKEIKHNFFKFETRPMFYPISRHKHLNIYKDFENVNASILSKEVFMLPSHPNLTQKELEIIVDGVNNL